MDWLAADHVAAWWERPEDPEEKYFGGRPVSHFIALLDEKPVGMVQFYRWLDFPGGAAAVGARPGEVGLDYLIGDAELIGRGVGPAMIDAFLSKNISGRGDVSGVRVEVPESNRRSWRSLEKLGFRREQSGVSIAGREEPHLVYTRSADPEAATPGS